ncbi:hypothetical protein HanRHA438_Chr12g0565821 [Helianthus annuus]|uniref:Uncharacterized protein n=1 Tax=Helianthus annuus TaxID=4232 RepID=A0A9K3HIL5_HELAN|nr:hypothetical protein HanXRQr2_Chr12g0554481 [Helianthus annuus]KAJ0490357.1 hypothetical protein HanHA300_Chr12g0454521 [Helianthus annuus]KAJ0492601.1 hypothetical protein HanIR_Chr12g0576711 [Helianthus annuus]KAJ0494514.1 hypothetical protein HanIR_Chr12g0598341 [Helianthus annuus]KAJ0506275.1 hypothetical protein HanHA89_Chr12g0480101 [Helianthus annuus]
MKCNCQSQEGWNHQRSLRSEMKRFLDYIGSWIVSTTFKRDRSTSKSGCFTRRGIETKQWKI